jgi:hypothetical protein
MQLSTTIRDAKAALYQSTVGGSGVLKIFSGAVPANCAASDPSGLLDTITLPATFLTHSGGVTTLSGTWSSTASASGTAASFRVYDATPTCHIQGTVGTSGADMNLTSVSFTSGQTISITSCAITEGNA